MVTVMTVEIALPHPSKFTVEVHLELPKPQHMMSAVELKFAEDLAIIEVINRYQNGEFDQFLS